MIEALGVPHTEVELILLNDVSVRFSTLLSEGDRVAVYPKFEAFETWCSDSAARLNQRPLLPFEFAGLKGR